MEGEGIGIEAIPRAEEHPPVLSLPDGVRSSVKPELEKCSCKPRLIVDAFELGRLCSTNQNSEQYIGTDSAKVPPPLYSSTRRRQSAALVGRIYAMTEAIMISVVPEDQAR
jgi:hypothetical protein